jgi:hypothetical protein
MHTIIYAIVDAQTDEDALGAAQRAFDRLTGATPRRERVFDYCLTLDEVGADHPARDEGLPQAARVEEEPGKSLLGAAWAATVKETTDEVERVRAVLENRDARAIRRDEDRARQALARLGAPESPTTALYDANGLGLVRRERVVDVVTDCAEPWIVPADAHHHR